MDVQGVSNAPLTNQITPNWSMIHGTKTFFSGGGAHLRIRL
jgi:hypothetical protein